MNLQQENYSRHGENTIFLHWIVRIGSSALRDALLTVFKKISSNDWENNRKWETGQRNQFWNRLSMVVTVTASTCIPRFLFFFNHNLENPASLNENLKPFSLKSQRVQVPHARRCHFFVRLKSLESEEENARVQRVSRVDDANHQQAYTRNSVFSFTYGCVRNPMHRLLNLS